MKLVEVNSVKTKKQFISLAKKIYKDDLNWIQPLDNEIKSIFDPKENIDFKDGDAIRWILENDEGEVIGRIASFYNNKKAKLSDYPTGGIGFFECVDDNKFAHFMFDKAKEWLLNKGMEAMDGPINFGENDTNWGLLVEGFNQPTYGMQYHKPYYKALFESYGFKLYFNQYSYHRDLTEVFELPERFEKIAQWLMNRPGYEFKHITYDKVDKYVNDLVKIYNTAWVDFKDDFIEIDPKEVYKTFKKSKPIIDEELVWFAYHNNEPIAVFIILPDFNQILKHLNGKLDLPGIIKFLYYKRKKEMTRVRAIIAGVAPKYRNSGIESVVFKKVFEVLQRKKHIKELELSWVGDFNPKMMAIYKALGAKHVKTHITYRYLFDRDKPFVRYMAEEASKTEI